VKSIDFRGFSGPNGCRAPLEKFLNTPLGPPNIIKNHFLTQLCGKKEAA